MLALLIASDSLCLPSVPQGCGVAGDLAGEWLRVVTGRRQLCLQPRLCGLMEVGWAGLWLCSSGCAGAAVSMGQWQEWVGSSAAQAV